MQAEQLLAKIQDILTKKPDLFNLAESSLNDLVQRLEQSENILELRMIETVKGENFFVDSYQRGYKWTAQQVQALLDDIHEFKVEKDSDFYCLQPVVVKRTYIINEDKPEYYWELIDGQQRMTTIFIILSYLTKESFFKLRYETRKGSSEFLNQLASGFNPDEIVLTTIDRHYFYQAYQAIEAWFIEKEQITGFSRAVWKDKLLKHTKVIWYDVRPQEDQDSRKQSIEIFTRLNQGKIPLTDAELLKALLLQHIVKAYTLPEVALQKQIEMANQWDLIEQSLQDEDFWAFLSPHKGANKHTRIELLFELIAKEESLSNTELTARFLALPKEHRIFLYYANKLKINSNEHIQKTIEEIWENILKGFYRLNEWYQHDRLYHLIGYLIGQNYKTIEQLWHVAQKSKRDHFEQILVGFIADELKKIFKQDQSFAFEAIDYQSNNARPKLIALFTLFNIYRHEQQKTRFPFKQYYACKWDIEHIHAQQSPELSHEDHSQSWFEDQEKIIKSIPIENQTPLKTALHEYAAKIEDDSLLNVYLTALYELVGEISENIHTLDNLCLLPEKINRSIGNAPFFIKREDIITSEQQWEQMYDTEDKKIWFIPLASQQVFSKYFSSSVNQMLKWGIADREAYKKALITCFKQYGVQLDVGMGVSQYDE